MAHYKYTISKQTKAILSLDSDHYRTRIFEGGEMQNVILPPHAILRDNCIQHGASLQGRLDYVRKVTNLSYKLPVPICPDNGIFFFPTASTRHKDCIWLAFHNIKSFHFHDKIPYVEFMDNTGFFLNVSENILTKQYIRTAQIVTIYERPGYYADLRPTEPV